MGFWAQVFAARRAYTGAMRFLLLLSLVLLLPAALTSAQELRLVPMGSMTSFDPVKGRQDVTTFKLVVGDPSRQEQLAMARATWGSIAAP